MTLTWLSQSLPMVLANGCWKTGIEIHVLSAFSIWFLAFYYEEPFAFPVGHGYIGLYSTYLLNYFGAQFIFFLYWAWEPVQTGPCTATGRYICSTGSPWAGSQSLLWTHQYCDQHVLATHLWAVGRESLGWIPTCCCYGNLVMQKSKAHLFRSFCSDGLWKTVALKILLVCAVTSKSASCLLLNICLPGYLWHSWWDRSYKKPP